MTFSPQASAGVPFEGTPTFLRYWQNSSAGGLCGTALTSLSAISNKSSSCDRHPRRWLERWEVGRGGEIPCQVAKIGIPSRDVRFADLLKELEDCYLKAEALLGTCRIHLSLARQRLSVPISPCAKNRGWLCALNVLPLNLQFQMQVGKNELDIEPHPLL